MKLTVAAVGRLKSGPDREIVERYRQRVAATGSGVGITGLELLETSESKARSREQRMREEAQALAKLAGGPFTVPGAGGVIICLDERGRALSSTAFADTLRELAEAGEPRATFLIGGPDGLDRDLLKQARLQLSLSAMTLPHGLARILLAEQIYRAVTIMSGHPYHRS